MKYFSQHFRLFVGACVAFYAAFLIGVERNPLGVHLFPMVAMFLRTSKIEYVDQKNQERKKDKNDNKDDDNNGNKSSQKPPK